MADRLEFSQIEEEEGKDDSMFNNAECLNKIEREAIEESQPDREKMRYSMQSSPEKGTNEVVADEQIDTYRTGDQKERE